MKTIAKWFDGIRLEFLIIYCSGQNSPRPYPARPVITFTFSPIGIEKRKDFL
jgi:hypothetical protein